MKMLLKPNENKFIPITITFIIGLLGGIILNYLNLPIPWLLGSMTALLIASRFRINYLLYWPKRIRELGLIIVGYSIGLSFTRGSLLQIFENLPSMIMVTLTIISFAGCMAYFVSKISGIDFLTVLTGSIPGGLSQIITFAEEVKEIDITTVTFFQVTRMLIIVFFVPLLIISPLFPKGEDAIFSEILQNTVGSVNNSIPTVIFFLILSILFAIIGTKLKLPTAFLLGPMIGTATLNIMGFQGPSLPTSLLDISQLMIGCYFGLLLNLSNLQNRPKMIILSFINGATMVCVSFCLSLIFIKYYHFSPVTAFLSLAPGGMDQLGIIAHEVKADLSIITSYQLFRVFFIYFAVPPTLKLLLQLRNRKRQNQVQKIG